MKRHLINLYLQTIIYQYLQKAKASSVRDNSRRRNLIWIYRTVNLAFTVERPSKAGILRQVTINSRSVQEVTLMLGPLSNSQPLRMITDPSHFRVILEYR